MEVAQQIDFIPKQTLDQLSEDVRLALLPAFDTEFNEIHDLPIELQRSEALEALGITEFYYGNYIDSVEHLEQSLSYTGTLERRGENRITFIKLLLAMARFRIGEPDKAVKELEAIGNLCVANNNLNFAIIAFTNVAVACSRASKHTEAERFSRQAIEYSLKVHHRASFEHLQHVRILIAICIRAAEYSKADTLIEGHDFALDEKKLLHAGLYYAVGKVDKAIEALEFVDNDDESSITSVGDLREVAMLQNEPSTEQKDSGANAEQAAAAPTEVTGAPVATGASTSTANSTSVDFDVSQESALTRHIMEVEKLVNKALVAFNSAMLKGSSYHDLFVPLRMIESLVGDLRKRKVLIDRACISASLMPTEKNYNFAQHNPFLKCNWNEFPDFLAADIYFFPVIAWSTILVAQTESRLLSYQFDTGLHIERGDIVPTPLFTNKQLQSSVTGSGGGNGSLNDGSDRFLETIGNVHKQTLAIIDACQFSTLSSPMSNVVGGGAPPPPSEIIFQDSSQLSVASGSLGGGPSVNSDIQDAIATSQLRLPVTADMSIDAQAKDSIDVTIVKDQVNSMQLFLSMSSFNDPVNATVSNAALNVLKNHNIDIDPNTGKFAVPAAQSPKAGKRGGKKSRGGTKNSIDASPKPGTANPPPSTPGKPSPKISRATSANPGVGIDPKPGSPLPSSGVSSPKPFHAAATAVMFSLAAATATPAPVAPVIPPYVPNKVDKLSSRSDLMPYIEKFGRDEVSAFIQWSIANMNGGLSLGFLGQSLASAQELMAFVDHEKSMMIQVGDAIDTSATSGPSTPSAKVAAVQLEKIIPRSEDFLREVRHRLAEIDTKLSLQLHAGFTEIYFKVYGNDPILNPHDHASGILEEDGQEGGEGGDEASNASKMHDDLVNKFAKIDPFPVGLLEAHIVVVMLLMKLSCQLAMKQEVETHINHFDRMSTLLYYRKPYSMEAKVYYALTFRWKMDFLEWLTDKHIFSSHNEHDRRMLYFEKFLPLAKKYNAAAKALGSSGDYHIQKDALKRLINVYLVIHRDSSSDHHSASTHSILSHHSVTMDDLLHFGKESIEYYEETDMDWVRKYGKLRAMQCMNEIKELSRKCST